MERFLVCSLEDKVLTNGRINLKIVNSEFTLPKLSPI